MGKFWKLYRAFIKKNNRPPMGEEIDNLKKIAKEQEDATKVVPIAPRLPKDAPYSEKNPEGWMPKEGEFGGLESLKYKMDELQEMGKSKTPFTDKMQKQLGDVKLFGDETFEELQIIKDTGKHPRTKKAAGGRIGYAYGKGLKLAQLLKKQGVALKDTIQESIDDFIQYSGDMKYDADVILDDVFERLAIDRDAVDQYDVIDAYGKVYDTLSMNRIESMMNRADEALEGLGTKVKKTRNENAGGGLNYLMGL